MKKLMTASLFFAALNVQAADFSYNNASVSYANVDIEVVPGFSIDGNGFDLEGNFEINKNLFIPVRYQTIGLDLDIDSTMYLVGIGGHMPLNHNMDLFGTAQFGNYEWKGPGGSVDDDILALTAGIRASLANNLEGMAYVTSISFDNDFNDQSGIGGKLNYYFNKNTSIVARAEFLSDMDTLSVGAQFDF